ncbi:mandelate racemase/muconate lactonizing enzyme family protein [Puniceicoccaceae bacterium K14]|nr:mandelate racemase/muconate lactonizing enzyme family protein [Puniceicoccaceae bacterium K14]
MDRRSFISAMSVLGGSSAIPLVASPDCNSSKGTDYHLLDEARKRPILKRELFSDPVIIESIELLRDRKNFICRVRSTDGTEGISISHPFLAKHSYPMFGYELIKRFKGKDARDLDMLIHLAAEQPAKMQGIPYCIQLATLEFAILDMLGNIVNKPAGQLIGDLVNPEISIYLGHHYSNLRKLPPEESLELMRLDAVETSARAIKLRAGIGDQMGLDRDSAPGRTEKLIRMGREVFGDDMVLMIDGNGSYSTSEAIRIGKILEEYNYAFYEEPVPWNWYEEQMQVERGLDIPMAGGEEEFSMHLFRYLIGNEVFQILQPDLFYFGGMIRTMQVARMTEQAGLKITPHISGGGLGYVYMMQMVSVCPAVYDFHEFKMFHTKDANGTLIPVESKAEKFESINGTIKAPSGSGLGLVIDPDYIKTHTLIES